MAVPGEAVEIALGLGLAVLTGFSANDWRRWLVEGVVYVVLAVFLLTLVGVVSL